MNFLQISARGALSTLVLLSAVGAAHAEFRQTTTPGSACKLDGVATSKLLRDIESRMSGTTNINAVNARNVVCPIARTQTTESNIGVTVDGKVKPGATLNCTLQSQDAFGALIASKSFTRTGTGTTGGPVTFFSANQTFFTSQLPSISYLSMQCSMPAGNGATIFGIRTVEQVD